MGLNRLAGESSPYLLQHAGNPVDWYPWGSEALELARSLDRPIFLSIGYSACHWCHVMERESFEDPETAALLNGRFVAIKVDREERPDLDDIYMAAVQRMTGRGGWPMSVFLTPGLRPFYGGTYFPGDRRYGMPSFRDVLGAVSDAWQDRRDEVERSSRRLTTALEQDLGGTAETASELATGDEPAAERGVTTAGDTPPATAPAPTAPATAPEPTSAPEPTAQGVDPIPTASPVRLADRAPLADPNLLDAAVASLRLSFDPVHGGWGTAPKFPQPMAIEFLLRRAVVGEDHESRTMALRSLDAMAAGGIHDQLGGGFHRYATDAAWRVPHFEKMLYDNAQLARVYVHAYQLTGEGSYRDVALATLDYVRREMTVGSGAFTASQDADTDGVEGGTFAWTLDEIERLVGPDAGLFAAAYGVSVEGNWEGRTILSRTISDDELARQTGIGREAVVERLGAARSTLQAARALRPQPARDDKVLASWNGMMLGAFADAARAIGRPEDIRAATSAAAAILETLLGDDGRLHRTWRAGRATVDGFLEDHAALADGLLALYEATLDEKWFAGARQLMDAVLGRFADPRGGFFDTADADGQVLFRPKHLDDGATPSGNAMAATVLGRLAAWTGSARYRDAAEGALRLVVPRVARYPAAHGQWLIAFDLALEPIDEIAIAGDPDAAETRALIDVARRPFRPHQVLAVANDPATSGIELMQSRFTLQGRPTAFVCRDFACRQPVTEPAALGALLGG